ncbi:MAG: DNA repair protein RecO [Dehalococcoidia bacterium]
MAKPPRVYKTPAIVLRQRKLGDTDKIITLYTAEFGKLDAVAKGVRRLKSRLAGHVEPLNHGAYMLARGRNLDIITGAQTTETFQAVREDLGRLSHALYAAELLDRATEERAENFALYRLLLDALRRLESQDDLDLALRYFEITLLGHLGYRPELDACVVCRRPLAEESCNWAPGLGGAVCASCRPAEVVLHALSVNALKILRLLQAGRYQDVTRVQLSEGLSAELERHLRDAVHYALDRDVRSAAFLDIVRRPVRVRSPRPPQGAGTH